MAKQRRPKTNSASAAIKVMDAMSIDLNRSWFVADLAKEVDLSIHAVTRALKELDGICVERRKLQWVLLPEPADIPDEKVLLEPEKDGTEGLEALVDYLYREGIEYSEIGYSGRRKLCFYQIFTEARKAKPGAVIREGKARTIVSVKYVGAFSYGEKTLQNAVKLNYRGEGYSHHGAEEIVCLRYYWSPENA